MKRLAIIGSGDLAKQIAYYALADKHYEPVGYLDDFLPPGTQINGLPVLGNINNTESLFIKNRFDTLMIGVGYKHFTLREKLFNRFIARIPFGTIAHSSSYIEKNCILEPGVCIYPGCVLDSNVIVKSNALLNIGCIIAHDSEIGEHSFLSPGINIAGFVKIGQRVNLGIGSIVIDNITISNNIRTGAGAVVTTNLEKSGLYVGIPAHFVK